MIKNYNNFVLENIINESVLVYSDKFKTLMNNIDSPVAKALLDIETKDLQLANNFIDVSDDKEQISFIPDRRAQQLFNPDNLQKYVYYAGDGGLLTHSDANNNIFNLLGYEPTEGSMFRPEVGEKGEVLSKAVGPTSGKTYLKIQFANGISVINQDKVRYDDPSKLAFTQGRQKIRVGRGIRALLNSANLTFSDSEIERFVNLYKAEIEKMNDIFRNFERVKGDDISEWYNYGKYELGRNKGTLSNSCMSAVSSSFFEIYTSNDACSMLILKTDDGTKIKGRALVWDLLSPEGITYMDRIYTHNDSDVELFRQYAQKQGWHYKPNNNNEATSVMVSPSGESVDLGDFVVKVGRSSYSKYPYVDTIKYFDMSKKTLSTNSAGYDVVTLEDTGGGYINDSECDFCSGEGSVDCPDCDGIGTIDCSECGGVGDFECAYCEGEEEIDCSYCSGGGEVECSICDGSGKDDDDNDCSDCDGKGRIECDDCDGSGKKECTRCDSGRNECDDCGGRGKTYCHGCDGERRVDCPECE